MSLTNVSNYTALTYQRHADYLVQAFERDYKKSVFDNFYEFLNYVEKKAEEKDWSSATKRQYKAALAYYFWNNYYRSLPDSFLENDGKNGNGKRRNRRKFIKNDDMEIALSVASKSKSHHLWRAVAILYASSKLGLRPIEWFGARLLNYNDNYLMLLVRNGKWSEDEKRTFGRFRHILINRHHPEFDRVQEVASWLISEAKKEGSREAWRKSVSLAQQAFARVRNKYPSLKGLTIYSARHQFSADLKRMDYHPYEISAMMGHADPVVHRERYGYRRKGNNGGRLVEAWNEDVEKVKKKTMERLSRRSKTKEMEVPTWLR